MDTRLTINEECALTDADTFHRLPTGKVKLNRLEFVAAIFFRKLSLVRSKFTAGCLPRTAADLTERDRGSSRVQHRYMPASRSACRQNGTS